MKICMLGCGALGSTIGGTLAKSGEEVYFLSNHKEHIEKINQYGLKMTDEIIDEFIPIDARISPEGIGPVDLVIILLKAFQTKDSLEVVKNSEIFGAHTIVMSLQNGLGNEELIADIIGRDHVIGGKTYVGGRLIEPGFVSAGVKGKKTIIGELDGSITDRVQRVADIFNKAGLICEVSENITGLIWDKLLINIAAGALCAITRLPYGPLYEEEYLKDCGVAAVAEAVSIAKAVGVTLTSDNPEDAWYAASAGLPGTFKTSMQQSIESGRRTEIDFINGAIVSLGEKYGIATPVNKTLSACVKGIEKYVLEYEPGLRK